MDTKKIALVSLIAVFITAAFMILNEGTAQPKAYKVSFSSMDVIEKYFSKETVEKALKQQDVVEVRMYYSRQSDGKPTFILVAVDKKGNEVQAGVFLPLVRPCPPDCGIKK